MFELLGCSLPIEPDRMSAIIRTESAANPFAVAVVGHRLSSQPTTLKQAVALADKLKSEGLNYSLGLGQVNQVNFGTYNLDHTKAFDVCTNLTAASSILGKCYSKYKSWDKAYSCYYSGNPKTGFDHGYVDKIAKNMKRGVVQKLNHPTVNDTLITVSKYNASHTENPAIAVNKSPTVTIKQFKF